jgi:hypothetical protein
MFQYLGCLLEKKYIFLVLKESIAISEAGFCLISSLREDSSASSSLEAFNANVLVFSQPREGPCSKAAIWNTSTFSCGASATFLREKYSGGLKLSPVRSSCGEY